MEFHLTETGRHFYEGTLPDFVKQLDRLNNNLEKIVAGVERTHKDNDQWLAGRVTIDASTHMVLLEAVQKLSGHFDKWFELQTKPREMTKAMEEYTPAPLYWSIEDGWVDLCMATLFSDHQKNGQVLPIGGAWIKNPGVEATRGGWFIAQANKEAAMAGEQKSLDGPDPAYLRELAEKIMYIPVIAWRGSIRCRAPTLDRQTFGEVMPYTTETVYQVWDDRSGEHIDVGPD